MVIFREGKQDRFMVFMAIQGSNINKNGLIFRLKVLLGILFQSKDGGFLREFKKFSGEKKKEYWEKKLE